MEAVIIAIGALITALGGAVASVTLGVKNLAEARETRVHAETAAHEVTHNSGSSLKDAVARMEKSQLAISGVVDEIRADVASLRAEKAGDHADMRRRLTSLERRRASRGIWPWT